MQWSGEKRDDSIKVFPENWLTVQVFTAMLTQWNAGFSGVIGMRYEALPVVMNMLEIPKKERRNIFFGLSVMERAATIEMNRS